MSCMAEHTICGRTRNPSTPSRATEPVKTTSTTDLQDGEGQGFKQRNILDLVNFKDFQIKRTVGLAAQNYISHNALELMVGGHFF